MAKLRYTLEVESPDPRWDKYVSPSEVDAVLAQSLAKAFAENWPNEDVAPLHFSRIGLRGENLLQTWVR